MDPTFSHWPAIPPHGLRVSLTVLPSHECSYLPARDSTVQGLGASSVDAEAYEALLNAGFRRSGHILYQPICAGCRECVPLRIHVPSFLPTKSHRRVARRNADLTLHIGQPELTDEKLDLYAVYLNDQHRKPTAETSDRASLHQDLKTFLYESPVATLEMTYRDKLGQLIAVGIIDVTPTILSTVYFFWHPDHAQRSLGIFGVLQEIELARDLGRPWYHMGYWVNQSATMDYKAAISDHELLGHDGHWRLKHRKPQKK